MNHRIAFLLPGLVVLTIGACSSDPSTSSTTSSSSGQGGASSSATTGPGGPGSGGSSSSAGGGTPGTGGSASQVDAPYFPPGAVWYEDVSKAPVAPDSSAITQWMEQEAPPNGWGTGSMKVDFSIVAVDVPDGTMKRTYQTVQDYYYIPDCDFAAVPVPQGGAVEETYGTPTDFSGPFTGYNCFEFDNGADCHMLFVSRGEKRLYEIYHATIDPSNMFLGGCLAIWDTSKVYGPDGRGQQCSSADAAGFPIAPLLFSADEIQAGVINHAIRFILPNSMIRAKKYVYPATHGTDTTGPQTSLPYGGRMRLRADYPLNTLSPAAQVVAKAMQKYGMLHADGGNIALTAQSDLLSEVKWADVGFDANSLNDLKATDFEVIDAGPTIDVTFDCQRQQITQ
jgi:serine/threonine-protein kinase